MRFLPRDLCACFRWFAQLHLRLAILVHFSPREYCHPRIPLFLRGRASIQERRQAQQCNIGIETLISQLLRTKTFLESTAMQHWM